nr:hypothetical protein [Belnapia arida]
MDTVLGGVRMHLYTDEPRIFQQAAELCRVAEAQRRVHWHARRVRCPDFSDGLAEQRLEALPLRSIPPCEGERPVWHDYTHALGDSGLRAREMSEPETANQGIEGSIAEGQGLDLRFMERNTGMKALGQRNHTRREVHPGGHCPSRDRCSGDPTRPGRHVEDSRARPDCCRIEKRWGGEGGYW